MDYRAVDTYNCSLGRAVDLVGQPWVVLILREVVWGVRRFADMQEHLGVSKSVLSDRLEHLVTNGVLARREYQQPGQRKRFEYHLTEKGADLYPVLTALRQWGDKYLAGEEGPQMYTTHRGCGGRVGVKLMCDHGHEVSVTELERVPGPGLRLRDVA
jgi:DNA-binding HxlR family transcriptional regulator